MRTRVLAKLNGNSPKLKFMMAGSTEPALVNLLETVKEKICRIFFKQIIIL